METAQDRINRLQMELAGEKAKQSNCRHSWNKPFKKEFVEREEYATGEYEGHGSDFYPKSAFRDKPVWKWVRLCADLNRSRIKLKL